MSTPALQLLTDTGGTLFALSYIHVGSDDLSDSLRRQRAGIKHERYGVTVAARTWKQARVWTYNINAAPQSYIESLRDFFEAGSFYLYPDSGNTAVKYTVFWEDDNFSPVYLAPNLYTMNCTFKETTIGAAIPAFLTAGGNQTVGGNLSVGGSLGVTGNENIAGNSNIVGNLTVSGTVTMPNLSFDTVKSNGDIFVNHNGPDGTSRLWFYDNNTASGAALTWDNSSNYFIFNNSIASEGGGANFGKGATAFVMGFNDFDGYIMYVKSSHAFTTLQPWTFGSSINIAGNTTLNGAVTGYNTVYIDVPDGNYRALVANDADLAVRPSKLYGSAWGVNFEDTGGTAVSKLGVYYGAPGGYLNAGYGFIGYGIEPHVNTYMRWVPSGITNAGRLTIDAPSFYVTPAIECSSWVRGSSLLGNGVYANKDGTTVGWIQFSGSSNDATRPRITWSGNNDSFNINKTVVAPAVSATTYSGIPHNDSITILNTKATERMPLFYTTRAIVFDSTAALVAGTSPSVTWQLRYGTDASGTGTIINSAVTTSTTTGHISSTMISGAVAANNWVWLTTSATGGTVTQLHLTARYREV